MSTFMHDITKRRSIYALGKTSPVQQHEIETIVKQALMHTPSPFNIQMGRAVLLFDRASNDLWQMVSDALRVIVPADTFADTKQKIDSFAAGYGTVLFFADQDDVEQLQAQFPSYSDYFPGWAKESMGMLQFTVWTAFASVGLGASLQHYSNLIAPTVKQRWSLPDSWQLYAQMPFGAIAQSPDDKTFKDIDVQFRLFSE